LVAILSALVALSAQMLWAQATAEQSAPSRKPVLVCSTTQIADFARQVAGDDCEVRCILAPGADPHTYMPTPADVRLAQRADICLQNGLHLEGKNWMATLARDAGKQVVTCADGIRPIELKEEGQTVSDPHAWFSPRNAAAYVNNIVNALCRLDLSRKDAYAARAKLYLQQLRVLDAWVREQVNKIPPDRRILVTSHDAFNYFAGDFGFRHKAPVGWSTGSEIGAGMTPERRKQVVESIKSFGVRAVFVETSVNPKLVREIARDAGVQIGGRLYSDSMGESGSAGESYIGMMRENVLTIVGSLQLGR
jgi:manganese/iron transport system substrate-binding protein